MEKLINHAKAAHGTKEGHVATKFCLWSVDETPQWMEWIVERVIQENQ